MGLPRDDIFCRRHEIASLHTDTYLQKSILLHRRFCAFRTSHSFWYRRGDGTIRSFLRRAIGGPTAPVGLSSPLRRPAREVHYICTQHRNMGSEAVVETQWNGLNGGEGVGVPSAANPRKRVKLHGRAFYESIGSPKLILAPMVEQSEFVRCALRPIPTSISPY